MSRLYLLFIVVPLVELALLLQVGVWIGPVPTIGLVVATAIVGASLARWQGLSAIERMRTMSAAGRLPAEPIFDGVLILLAAALLLTPGILTDVVGFLLLVPVTRRAIRRRIGKRFSSPEDPAAKVEREAPRPPKGGKVIDQDGNIVE